MKHYSSSTDLVDPLTGHLRSGKCWVCGEDRGLIDHTECKKKLESKRAKVGYSDAYIKYLSEL